MEKRSRKAILILFVTLILLATVLFYNKDNDIKIIYFKQDNLNLTSEICKLNVNVDFIEDNVDFTEDKAKNNDYVNDEENKEEVHPDSPKDDNISSSDEEIMIEIKEVIKDIPFNIIKKEDGNLELGREKVIQKGKLGKHRIIYEVIYVENKKTKRKEIKSEIAQEPIDEIIIIGIKELNDESKNKGVLPIEYPYEYKKAYEDKMLKLINEHRINNNVKPLIMKNELNKTARYKSLSMVQLNYFGHHNPNFEDESFNYLMTEFFKLEGYSMLGENLAYKSANKITSESIDEIFLALKESKGHNENMLHEDYEYIGIGIVLSVNSGDRFENLPSVVITHHFGKSI